MCLLKINPCKLYATIGTFSRRYSHLRHNYTIVYAWSRRVNLQSPNSMLGVFLHVLNALRRRNAQAEEKEKSNKTWFISWREFNFYLIPTGDLRASKSLPYRQFFFTILVPIHFHTHTPMLRFSLKQSLRTHNRNNRRLYRRRINHANLPFPTSRSRLYEMQQWRILSIIKTSTVSNRHTDRRFILQKKKKTYTILKHPVSTLESHTKRAAAEKPFKVLCFALTPLTMVRVSNPNKLIAGW